MRSLASDLLGNIKVNLVLSDNPLKFIGQKDTIPGIVEMGMMAKAAEMIPAIEKMMPKARLHPG